MEGGEETRVIDKGEEGHWAITNQGVYLLSVEGKSGPAIELFSFANRRVQQIAALPREARIDWGRTAFAVSPDARWFLYTAIDHSESNIMLVENFR